HRDVPGLNSFPTRRSSDLACEDRYAQQAVILNCTTDKPHAGVAYERFIASGPLAMLPLPGGRVGAVWTLPADDAERMAALTDERSEEHTSELQSRENLVCR